MKSKKKILEYLSQNQLWDKKKTIARNEFIKVSGTTDTNIYYINSGSLRIFVIDEDEEHTIRFGYQDNIIVSLDSFITEKPSDLYIQAIKKTELSIIKKESFMQIINHSEDFKNAWIQNLQDLILQQMERERDLLTSSPLERYKRVLARSPQLFQEIPNKYIASYLRMTAETLSRIKKV